MALGANRSDVLWMVLRETLWLALAGGGIGIALMLACARLVESALFGLKPSDPTAIGVATVLTMGVARYSRVGCRRAGPRASIP
jgi:ABC-type antimicrobial peptide transport system permease subunit